MKTPTAIIIGALCIGISWYAGQRYAWSNPPQEIIEQYQIKRNIPSWHGWFKSDWGTYFVFNDDLYHAASRELYDCTNDALRNGSPESIRSAVVMCDDLYYETMNISQSPPIYWALEGSQNDGWVNVYEEFDLCIHSFSAPAWDFPEDTTVDDVRNRVQDCLDYFPYKNVELPYN